MSNRRDELLQEFVSLYDQLTPQERETFWTAFMEKHPHLETPFYNWLLQESIAQQKTATVAKRKATIAANRTAAQV